MEYLITLATLVLIFAVLGMSLNLVVGYTGLLSVAQASFAGIGAYTLAILMTAYGVSFLPALAAAIIVTVVVSAFIGGVLSRFAGDYYALVSVGFNIIVFSIFLNWTSLTRGSLGIPGIPRPTVLGFSFASSMAFLLLCLIAAALVYALTHIVTRSSFGRVLMAIREDEQAISVFGYRTQHYKLLAFVMGASIAAIGGALFASYLRFIDPPTFAISESIFLLAMIIFGGLGSLDGPVVGAVFLILLPEALRFVGFPDSVAAELRQLIYGLLLILFMRYRSEGIVGEYRL